MTALKGPVGVVAYDAGGAEVISAYLRQCAYNDVMFSLGGPAVSVFARNWSSSELASPQEIIRGSSWVLTGTGWQSKLEWFAIRDAVIAGKRVVSFLDNWVNYVERFWRDGMSVRPDEIWVTDAKAEGLARTAFPETIVRLVPVPRLHEEFKAEYLAEKNRVANPPSRSILFLNDNVTRASLSLTGSTAEYDDIKSLSFLLENLDVVGGAQLPITVRPHPSQQFSDLEEMLSYFGKSVVLSSHNKLAQDLAHHEIVVGSDSFGMVHAVHCGMRVLSALPPKSGDPAIPLDRIELLRDMVI